MWPLWTSPLVACDGSSVPVGVTRKQLGLTFLGETRQDFVSVIGDVCLEVNGIDRKVGAISCLEDVQYEAIH